MGGRLPLRSTRDRFWSCGQA